jgi:small subunit ribosomal protein S13
MEQRKPEQKQQGRIVRILSKDIEGNMSIYAGLTKIKGISWGMSNAICKSLKIDKKRKIGSITPEEMTKMLEFIKSPKIPNYLKNRRQDFETGEDKHLVSSDLELRKEFDIKRLKKIRSYRGLRHLVGLPLRGQRTKGHFRKNRSRGVGIKKKKKSEVKKEN